MLRRPAGCDEGGCGRDDGIVGDDATAYLSRWAGEDSVGGVEGTTELWFSLRSRLMRLLRDGQDNAAPRSGA